MRVALACLLGFVLVSCAAAPASPPAASLSPAAVIPSTPTDLVATPTIAAASPSASPDGPTPSALISEMDQAVAAESTALVTQTWIGAQSLTKFDQGTDSKYQRPDRRQAVTMDRITGKVTTVIEIGPTRYVQVGSGAPWQVTQPAVPYKGEITVIQSFDLAPMKAGTAGRSVCPSASCFVIAGGYDLPPGGRHNVTLTIDAQSHLPLQSTTTNSYADGTSYTVTWLFSDWGIPMNIQAPKL